MDPEICYRAVLARDARFDGLFFTAVRTTRIFCRPVCPARTPYRHNVEFFSNAAAAQAAGYRPCLRCRPEVSPDTPAWAGTSATVQRALRLIDEGALDAQTTADLAARLGLTDRHLRRLFLEHVGVPPVAVAQTRRTLFAKNLISETSLPFSEIAFAAGFASLRRFNESIRKMYGRNPRELRRFSPPEAADSAIELELHYRPPYDWEAFLAFVRPRAIPGLEEVSADRYQRAGIVVRNDPSRHCLTARIEPANARSLRRIAEQIRFFFDLRANLHQIAGQLGRDRLLKETVKRRPGLRLPGCWDAFELAVRAMLGQQVTVKGATTLAGRLVERFGAITPAILAEADVAAIGLPKARAESIRAFARAMCDGQIRFDASVSSSEMIGRMCELPGIGPWTANYIAMRALGDPDAFPASDLGLLKAADVSSPRRLEEMAERWRPWRAYAAMYLWESLREPLRQKG
ncbi:MAG TPA: Ada metal-binding domain-containing protein [Bryobacteraceae bacterium]|nr:Ada metal-binding domain-containing protein [Bryobacteraceae bacterium]